MFQFYIHIFFTLHIFLTLSICSPNYVDTIIPGSKFNTFITRTIQSDSDCIFKVTNSQNYGTNLCMQIGVLGQAPGKEKDKDPQHCPSLQGHGTSIQTAECNA